MGERSEGTTVPPPSPGTCPSVQHPPRRNAFLPHPYQGIFGTLRGGFLTISQQGIFLGLWLGDLLYGLSPSRNFTYKSLESRKSL